VQHTRCYSGGKKFILLELANTNRIPNSNFMKSDDISEITQLLAELREEHRDLDRAINRMAMDSWQDQLQIRRLKKRKLKLKDWIAQLESKLIPDLDA